MANLLATCSTKLTVNGTTTAPEHLMVCGSARFVNSSAHDIYMGTSHGSVDISFQRAASQDFKIRTYSGGWNDALRILGTCVYACTCLQSPVLCSTGCVKTERIQALGGLSCFSAPSGGSNFDDWECSPITIRERGLVTSNQNHCCYSPNINFHWAGRVSNSLWMDAAGNFNFGSYNGANVPSADGRLNTAILYGSTCVVSPILCATSCTNYGACATSKLTSDGNNMKHTTQYGFISLGPANSSWAHINTDRNCFYIHKPIAVDGGYVCSYDENLVLQRTGSGTARFVIADGVSTSCQKMTVCTCIESPILCATTRADVNTICATSGMSRSFPTWSIMGTRYLPQVTASANLPVGWYTIFVNTGNRAGGRFILRDTTGSRHQYVVFYASHSYGNGNSINVLQYSRYSGQPIQCVRVKDFDTYSGAALQVYVCDATNNLVAYEAGDNVHSSGWYFLNSWCCDACVPYSYSCFNACWPAGCYCDGASVNLHCIQDGGQILTGKLYAPVMRPTTCIQVGNAGTAKILLNASYNTLELCGHGSEMMIGAGSTGININYRCAGSGASTTPANWYWRCGTSTSFSNHYFALVCSCSLIKGNILCGATCVYSNCLYVNNAQADVCVKSPTLCATSKFQGSCLHIDGGNLNSGNDAAIYVTATNNNDWGIVVNKNNGSATDYAFDARMGASAGHAYYARFNNTVKFTVRYDCLCHASLIKSPIVCGPTCVSAAVVCSTGIVRATAGCFVSSADNCFSGMIKTSCNLIIGAGGENRTLSVRHIDGKCHTDDTSDTLYLQYSTGKNVIVGSGSSTSHLYTYGNIYGCGSCISTATVCATAVAIGNRFKSSARLWNTQLLCCNNFFADSGASGGDGFALGQGTGILDIWVKDDSVGELRSVFRANNQGNSIVIGRGCSANDNANIPVYACSCLQSPMFCATSCIRLDGTLRFTQNTPYICTGGAYVIVPGGIYVSGGTLYAENTIMARNGICDDTAAILDIWGGNDSAKCTNLRGKTYVCNCLYVHCNICLAPDSSGDMQNGISLGKVGGLPQAAWGESGSKTGRIEIGLPTRDGEGGTVHHGMVHVAIDVYEYNANDATTIIVGGHNWNCRWYNCGAHMTGGCSDKTIKLAYHSCGGTNNGRYVILLGECDSTWSYGSVHVRSITNGLYYCDNMNMGTPWYVKRVTCADSHYNQTTADLRSSSNSMAGYQCAMVCLHTPRVCATTCLQSANVCATTMICSAACVQAGTCVYAGTAICAVTHGSIHTAGNLCCGLAVGQAYSNEGGWHNQLNTYGSQHNIIRIKKAAGDTGNNAQCLALWVHNSQPATIMSSGNLLLKAAGGVGMCLLNGAACSAVIKGSTCVVSPMVFPTGCLQFDQTGTRSWKVCASGGNLNFHSGDGSGSFYFHSAAISNIFCGTTCLASHLIKSGPNNMCLCPSGCGYGLFLGNSNHGEKHHWVTDLFTASGTQARRAKILEFSYNTHHWDSGGPIIIEIFRNYYGKGSSQKWQIVQTGLDGTGSQNCSAGADLPAGARDVSLMLLESSGPDTNQFKLHLDMHAAGFKISDYDVGIAEVYLDVDYYAQVSAKVTLQGTWYNINTGASFTTASSSQYKFYNSPSYTNISTFHNAAPTVPSTGGRILFVDRIYGSANWQACCQNCYTNLCGRYLCLGGISCLTDVKTSGTICSTGTVQGATLCGGLVCFTSCLKATGGCIKVPIMEARYSDANTNYRGGMCWSHVQLGNNGVNRIIAGATATGGYLDIHTNNTADVLGGTATNGTHNARFCTNGYTHFMDWIQLADSKGIFTATNNGHFRGNTTSTYGTWDILGNRNNWGGIYICGMTVMAKDDCSQGGLFNDVDDEWMVRGSRNAGVQLYFDGAPKVETYANGITVCANSHSTCIYPHASWSHFYTTASKYFFDHEIRVNSGVVSSYDEPLKLATCGTVRVQVCETCLCSSLPFLMNHGGDISPTSGAAGQFVVHGNGYSTFLAMNTTAAYFGHNSSARSLVLMTNETARLTIDGSGAATFAGTVTASGGFYGDGSNLSGISAGIDGCSFQGAVGNPSGCNYERTTNVRLGTCAMPTGKGVHSTAIGNNALRYQNCSWYYGNRSANTAVGADSQQCSMGFQNTSVGWMALRGAANNCKCFNVGIGACTGYLGILGNYAVAIGTGTDRYMSDCSVAVGAQADAGNEAVMVGFSSGANDGTFKGDVAMGYRSLYSSGCGCYRIAIGHCAGYAQGQWNHKEKYTIAIGACALACGSHTHDAFNYNIVIGNPHNSCAAGQCLSASTSGCMILGDGNINNACICAACTHVSTLNKSSGSFRIKHPNPSCSNNRTLYHSFVESPNEGDNIYRWQVETSNCVSVVTLPNYYRYLNKNDMVWVSPYRHFGSAYGEVTADQCCLIICSNSDGCFNVLLVGTRKDSAVSQSWKGVERDEEWTEPCYG